MPRRKKRGQVDIGASLPVYTEQEAAAVIKVSVVTLRKLRYEGQAQYSKFGRLVRYTEDDLRATCERNRRTMTGEKIRRSA